jgi:hypothetical protein
MSRDEAELRAALRELDQPVAVGQWFGWEFPADFDIVAMQARFDRLADRFGEVFGCKVAAARGPQQDAAYFGALQVASLSVLVSNFGGLATYLPADGARTHPEDEARVAEVLTGLGYRVVPQQILAHPYDGPNAEFCPHGMTWHDRYFSHL